MCIAAYFVAGGRDFLRKNKLLVDKVKESLKSVLPITLIVLLITFTISPVSSDILLGFAIGAVMLVVGMGLFTLGADLSMTTIGERIGAHMTKSRKLTVIIIVSFIIGIIITVAEPDLQVLAEQVPGVPNMTLIISVALGVGLFLVMALLRIIFRIPITVLLVALYIIAFALTFFVPQDFLAVAFDSGGVTTGPMTVPFIMALGVGVSSLRNDKDANRDSFGLVALCSIGPILAVLILGMIYNPDSSSYTSENSAVMSGNSRELICVFLNNLPKYLIEVAISLSPILAFFILYDFAILKLPKGQLIKIFIGFVYTYLGLVLFLTGVNVGFMPLGSYLGEAIGKLPYKWILVPLSMIIGYFIVAAEPAVHVLNKQVEEITDGAISPKSMGRCLSIGVAISLGLAMIRVLTGISIMWLIVPGYALAIILSFLVPSIFTSIAFDSGGVASGPMTATFLLPFAMGTCTAVGGNIANDAFGVVAMVAMTPLITIQIMGLYYKLKQKTAPEEAVVEEAAEDDEIIEL